MQPDESKDIASKSSILVFVRITWENPLSEKRLWEYMKSTSEKVWKIINFMKSRPLQSRFFKVLCKNMWSEHVLIKSYCTRLCRSEPEAIISFVIKPTNDLGSPRTEMTVHRKLGSFFWPPKNGLTPSLISAPPLNLWP